MFSIIAAAALMAVQPAADAPAFTAGEARRVLADWTGAWSGEGEAFDAESGSWSPRQLTVRVERASEDAVRFRVNDGAPAEMRLAPDGYDYILQNGTEIEARILDFETLGSGEGWRMRTQSVQPGPGGAMLDMLEEMSFDGAALERRLEARPDGSEAPYQPLFRMRYTPLPD